MIQFYRRIILIGLLGLLTGCLLPQENDISTPTSPGAPGDRVVQEVVAAIAGGDRDRLGKLIHYTQMGCTEIGALGGPPRCRPGEQEGDSIAALPVLGVEGVAVRPDEIEPVIDALLTRQPAVAGLLRCPVESYSESGWLPATHGVLLVGGTPPLTMTLLTDAVGIVRIYDERTLAALQRRVFSADGATDSCATNETSPAP